MIQLFSLPYLVPQSNISCSLVMSPNEDFGLLQGKFGASTYLPQTYHGQTDTELDFHVVEELQVPYFLVEPLT